MAVKSTHLYVTAELSYIIRTKLDRHIHSLMMQFKILPALALMAATVSAGLQPGFEPALEDTLKDDAHLRRLNHYSGAGAGDLLDHINPKGIQGPWPECIGKPAVQCENYIRGYVGEEEVEQGIQRRTQIHLISSNAGTYRQGTMWIHCDQFGQVLDVPQMFS